MQTPSKNEMTDPEYQIVHPGRNCRQLARARRAAVLLDGENYFSAFHRAALNARRQIIIVGWDIHSKVELLRGDAADQARIEGVPLTLGPLLNHLAKQKPELGIHILIWNFSMLLSMERDPNLLFNLGWALHPRIQFHLDGEHPVGASQHQKIVVMDGQIAFCGGLDLSHFRWDTSRHEPNDPRRTTPGGDRYGPYHDAMMLVDGEAASQLAEICAIRWQRATREKLPIVRLKDEDVWPESVQPWFEDVDVAIALTEPAHKSRDEVREVEALFLDSIRAATHSIFIENQYFTSPILCSALEDRLRDANGPEVVIILPKTIKGWLGNKIMEIKRVTILKRLKEADVHGRLRLRHPWVGEDPKVGVMVHAKLMVVDDIFLRVGSANLCNRSLGLDTECDLAIEASSDSHKAGVRRFRDSLLAMHLGVEPDEIRKLTSETQSLIQVVDHFSDPELSRSADRGLSPLQVQEEDFPGLVSESEILDPESPMEVDRLMDAFVPDDENEKDGWLQSRWMWLLLGALALAGMALAWHYTPLSELTNREALAAAMQEMALGWSIYPLIVLGYLVGGLIVFPVTVLIGATAIILDPVPAMLTAFIGTQLSAILTYGVGRKLGRRRIQSMAGSRLNRISKHLGRHGVLSIALLRTLPVAPFTIVNFVAGASHIRFIDYALGTLLGMTPGILAVTVFTDQLLDFLRQPDLTNVLIMAGALIFLVLSTRWLKRRFT